MILKIIATTLVFLIAYGGFLISNAPAAWVVSRINPRLSAVHASITDPGGGAWSGSGELHVNGMALGRLDWNAAFWPLVTGHLDSRIRLHGSSIEATARLDAGGETLRLAHLDGRADLQTLARLANLPPEAKGTLVADVSSLRLSGRGALESAEGTIDVHGTSLPDLGVQLGTLHLTLRNAANHMIHGVISNQGGDLDISGQINLYNGSRYTMIAYLKPHPGSKNDPMRDALAAMLGQPDAQGRYHYNTSGRLSP